MDRSGAGAVAVIDDDEDVCEVLRVLLENAGHSVTTYTSGAKFLAEFDRDEVACLVVDQKMPQMTGLSLLLELERRGVIIPALLITGANDADIEREASRLGAMTVMQKPVPPQELLQFVGFSAG